MLSPLQLFYCLLTVAAAAASAFPSSRLYVSFCASYAPAVFQPTLPFLLLPSLPPLLSLPCASTFLFPHLSPLLLLVKMNFILSSYCCRRCRLCFSFLAPLCFPLRLFRPCCLLANTVSVVFCCCRRCRLYFFFLAPLRFPFRICRLLVKMGFQMVYSNIGNMFNMSRKKKKKKRKKKKKKKKTKKMTQLSQRKQKM